MPSQRREFFQSVMSRLTPPHPDYDQFILREDAPGEFRLCVEMTGICTAEQPWFLTSDEEGATYWRRGMPPETWRWTGDEPAMISDREQARATAVVKLFSLYMHASM